MASLTPPVVVTAIAQGFKLTFHGPIQAQIEWLRSELERVIKSRPAAVDLDLMGIEFIASEGLGILLDLRNRIVAAGGSVKTVAVHPRVLGILKMAQLLPVLNVQVDGAE
jgi:anti-anti-sigma factor